MNKDASHLAIRFVKFFFVTLSVVVAYYFFDWSTFLICYQENGGYKDEGLGYPIPIAYAMFYAGFSSFTLIGFLLMVFSSKIGWLFSQIAMLFSMIILGIISGLIVFDKANLSYWYIAGFLATVSVFIFLNSAFILNHLKLKRSFWLLGVVFFGAALVGLIAAFAFRIF